MAHFIAVLVEYPANRPVFDMVPLVLQPPTKIHVFSNHHVISKATHLKKGSLSY
jgi:hypothetical protein